MHNIILFVYISGSCSCGAMKITLKALTGKRLTQFVYPDDTMITILDFLIVRILSDTHNIVMYNYVSYNYNYQYFKSAVKVFCFALYFALLTVFNPL